MAGVIRNEITPAILLFAFGIERCASAAVANEDVFFNELFLTHFLLRLYQRWGNNF